MARFYSNENFPLATVETLRALGHNVLTSLEAGRANAAIPDPEVLAFAASESRILLTMNRLHFLLRSPAESMRRLPLHRREMDRSGVFIVRRDFRPSVAG